MNEVVTTARLELREDPGVVRYLDDVQKRLDKIYETANKPLTIPGGGGGPRVPPRPNGKGGILNQIVGDLTGQGMRDLSSATNLSTKTLTNMAGAAGMTATQLGGIVAIAGPVVLALATVAGGALAVAAGFVDAGGRAIEFQADMAGVAKTTNMSGKALDDLGDRILNLSTKADIGATAHELAQITEVAGQLGIKGSTDLETFTATMGRLAATSNIVGEHGSEQFGKFLAVTNSAPHMVSAYASAISKLSSEMATNERQVLSTGQEVAKGGVSYGLAGEDALAYAAVLDSLGVEAELSRSTMLRLGQTLQEAVVTGGDKLERLAKIAGVTSDELSTAFRDRAGVGIRMLLEGFAKVDARGGNVIEVMDSVGLSGLRLGAVVPTLAKNVDDLDKAMAMSASQVADPVQLFIESARAADTVERQWETLQNRFAKISTEIGQNLLPSLGSVVTTLDGFLTASEPVLEMIGAAGSIAIQKFAGDFQMLFGVLREGTEFLSTMSQENLFSALVGSEEIQQAVQDTNSLRGEIEKLTESLADGDPKKLGESYAALTERYGTSAAKAELLRERIDELGAEIKTGSGNTEELRRRQALLISQYNVLNTKAGLYKKALNEVNDELSFQKSIQAAGDAEIRRLATAADLERKAQQEAAEAVQRHNKELEKLAKSYRDKYESPVKKVRKELSELLKVQDRLDPATFGRAFDAIKDKLADLRGEVRDVEEQFDTATSSVENNLLPVLSDSESSILDIAAAFHQIFVEVENGLPFIEALSRQIDEMPVPQLPTIGTASQVLEGSGDAPGADVAFWSIPDPGPMISNATRGLALMTDRQRAYYQEAKRTKDLFDEGLITKETHRDNMEQLNDYYEGWERIGAKAIAAGEEMGGVWGKMLGKLGENMEQVGGALGSLSQVAAARGDTGNAQWLAAAQGFASGNVAGGLAGAIGATGIGQQRISQFGGRGEGNFMAEGAMVGSVFGPIGTVVGALVGAFVNKGADDLHSQMEEVAGKAQLKITQAEGELGETGAKIAQTVEGFLNSVQERILADLDLAGLEFHIREDRVRVVFNGMERVFHSLEEAIDFGLRQVLSYNAGMEGLGEEVKNMFVAAGNLAAAGNSFGDPERLSEAFNLAQKLDFEQTGVNEASIRAMQRQIEIGVEFGLSLDKILALRRKEIDAAIAMTRTQAAGVLGATDFATTVMELTRQMEVSNNTTQALAAADQARIDTLRDLIAQQVLENSALQETANETGEAFLGLSDASRLGSEALREQQAENLETIRTLGQGQHALERYQRELDALTQGLEEGQDSFAQAEFAALWEKAVNDAGLSLIAMIQAVEGPAAAVEEQRRLQHNNFMLQLGAQIQQAKIVFETMQFVSEASRQMFAGIIAEAEQLFEDLATGEKSLNFGGGGGRRKQRLEEEKRAEEEAAAALEEFTDSLETMRIEAMSTIGGLGALADRLKDIRDRAIEAAEAGASEDDVRDFQRLSFRDVRQEITDPFSSYGRDTFHTEFADVEQRRRQAIEAARMTAEAQAEALGVPFQVVFDAMADEINAGADRMKRDLVRAVVDGFDLPLEKARREIQSWQQGMADLEMAYKKNEIPHRRYLQLLDQISKAQTAALVGDIFSFAEQYGLQVADSESMKLSMMKVNYEIELATLQMRFNALRAEGLLAQETVEWIDTALTSFAENPPDWDAVFRDIGDSAGGALRATAGGFSSAVTEVSSSFDDLLDSIRQFVDGFNQVGLGPFSSMAQQFIDQIAGFQADFDQEMNTVVDRYSLRARMNAITAQVFGKAFEELTDEELAQLAEMDLTRFSHFRSGMEDMAAALLALREAGELQPAVVDNILAAYRGTIETGNELERQYSAINEEFLDVVNGMEMLGASAAQLADAERIHQERLSEFWDNALAGVRSLGERITQGEFGGLTDRERAAQARERFDDLRRRLEANPMDFEALQQIEQAGLDLIAAEEAFTGGIGPEMDRILDIIRQFTEGFDPQDPDLEVDPPAPTAITDRMDAQTAVFESIKSTMEEGNASRDAQLTALASAINSLAAAMNSPALGVPVDV